MDLALTGCISPVSRTGFSMSVYASNSGLSSMPDVSTLQFIGSAFVSTINFPNFGNAAYFAAVVPGTPNNNFAATFTGQLIVSTGGSYTFCTASDDGSTLTVDGMRIVYNAGVHGIQTVCGSITLSGGVYAVYIDYFQGIYAAAMQVTYSGPDTSGNMEFISLDFSFSSSCTACAAGTYSQADGATALS